MGNKIFKNLDEQVEILKQKILQSMMLIMLKKYYFVKIIFF